MDYVRKLDGIRIEYVWDVCELCMNLWGICIEFVWHMRGICEAYVWNMYA